MRALRWPVRLLTVLAASPVFASSLQISPVFLSLPPDQTATSISLRNVGATPVYGQVRVFRWTQRGGEDVLDPVDDVVASPPLIRVAPQSDQLVRLILRGTAPAKGEQSYRIVVDELPSGESARQSGVVIRLRYSVPLFVAAPSTAPPDLRWQLRHSPQGWSLEAANAGERHAQISAVALIAPDGKRQPITPGLLGYALGGQARAWPVAIQGDAPGAGRWRVEATVNARPAASDVELPTPP